MAYRNWEQLASKGLERDWEARTSGGIGSALNAALKGVLDIQKERRGQTDELAQIQQGGLARHYPETLVGKKAAEEPLGLRQVAARQAQPTRAERAESELGAQPLGGLTDEGIDTSLLQVPEPKRFGFWNKQEYRKVHPAIIEYAQGIKTYADLKAFLNEKTQLEARLPAEDIEALFDNINETILPYLTAEQRRDLEKDFKNFFE